MEKVLVNKIIPFSSVDGPGNRTAVFLQGCNIRCKYCHNPETRGMCVNCGVCVSKCPAGALSMKDGNVVWDERLCCQCDTCIHICPYDSTPRTHLCDAAQVYERVKKQIPYIRGISVSGGECMLHPQFLTELFSMARADGLGTLIDSNGTIAFDSYPDLMKDTDGVMLDIKAFDEQQCIHVTGHTNRTGLENAVYLGKNGKLEEVRFVIAPDLYDTKNSVTQAGRFLKPYYDMHPFLMKLIAFRPMGVRPEFKNLTVPSRRYLEELEEILRQMNYDKIILI